MGNDGQPATLCFTQGTDVPILPHGSSSRADLTVVEFTSFQLKGDQNKLGLFRYKCGEQHREIKPGQVGQRVLKAQLLAREPLLAQADGDSTREALRRSKRQPKPAARQPEEAQTVFTSKGLAPRAEVADCTETYQRDGAQKSLRAARDREHAAACDLLQEHREWLQEEDKVLEKDGRTIRMARLSAAAECAAFGEQRYAALMRVSFAVCVTCHKVYTSATAGFRHRCRPPDAPAQPLQRRRQPLEHLVGGIQLDTALAAQVIPLCSGQVLQQML